MSPVENNLQDSLPKSARSTKSTCNGDFSVHYRYCGEMYGIDEITPGTHMSANESAVRLKAFFRR